MADWLTREQRSFNMASIRSQGTKPEERLGTLLREMFPRHKLVAQPSELLGKPDYLLPGLRLVLFADGCFWHSCPRHGRNPEDNSDYWGPKLQRNKARDRRVARELRTSGYVVVRVWDHELRGQMTEARTKVRRALRKAG